jgi:hypothetical protein
MVRQKPIDGCCQHKFENGKQCCEEIDGQGAWYYCSGCRQAAQREAKRERDRKRSAERRKADREGDNFYHFLFYHDLTEPKLQPLFDHIETLQEEYTHRDDFHEGALDYVNDIMRSLLNPPDDIPSAAITTRKRASSLLNKLKRQQAVYPDRMTDRLIVYTEELQRDSGMRISPRAFTAISGKAKEVLGLWREQQEIPGFIYALFVNMELNRLKFLAMPHQRRFLGVSHLLHTTSLARDPGS